MKKKIITFLLSIFFIFPCMLLLSACEEGSSGSPTTPSSPPTSQSPVTSFGVDSGGIEFYLRDINAMSVDDMTQPVFNGGTNKFSMWLADSYNRDTLKIFVNNTEVQWTKLEDPDYDDRNIDYFNIRKVGTLTLTGLKGNINITATCKEEEISLNFQPQELEQEKLDILSHFNFVTKDEGGNDIKTSFSTVAEEGFTIKSTYSNLSGMENELSGYTKGILVESDKKMGYYDYYSMIMSEEMNVGVMWDSHISGINKYQSYILMSPSEGLPKNIPLRFDPEKIEIANFQLSGMSISDSITSVSHNSWYAYENTDVTITLTPYTGVDFSNAKVLIYDTEVPVENVDGTYQITIPAGAMPVDYYTNPIDSKIKFYGDAFSPTDFAIHVEGLDYSDAIFHTIEITGTDYTNIGGAIATPYYSEFRYEKIDEYYYHYYNHLYRHNERVTTGLIFTNTDVRANTIILREKIDGTWVERSVNISGYYDLDPNDYLDNEYIVNNALDDIDVVVKFMYGELYSINLRFNVQYETQIAPGLN